MLVSGSRSQIDSACNSRPERPNDGMCITDNAGATRQTPQAMRADRGAAVDGTRRCGGCGASNFVTIGVVDGVDPLSQAGLANRGLGLEKGS